MVLKSDTSIAVLEPAWVGTEKSSTPKVYVVTWVLNNTYWYFGITVYRSNGIWAITAKPTDIRRYTEKTVNPVYLYTILYNSYVILWNNNIKYLPIIINVSNFNQIHYYNKLNIIYSVYSHCILTSLPGSPGIPLGPTGPAGPGAPPSPVSPRGPLQNINYVLNF